jgi:hypothetical protein
MYEKLDSFMATDTWHTRHPSDEKRFFTVLHELLKNRKFQPGSMADYMRAEVGYCEKSHPSFDAQPLIITLLPLGRLRATWKPTISNPGSVLAVTPRQLSPARPRDGLSPRSAWGNFLFDLDDVPFAAGELLQDVREGVKVRIALRAEHAHQGSWGAVQWRPQVR